MFGDMTVLMWMANEEANCMLKLKQTWAFPALSVKFDAFNKETVSSDDKHIKQKYLM